MPRQKPGLFLLKEEMFNKVLNDYHSAVWKTMQGMIDAQVLGFKHVVA